MRRLALYYLLACTISWGVWLPLWAPGLGLPALSPPVQHALGAFGPLVAALIVSAIGGGWPSARGLLGRIFAAPRLWWLPLMALLTPFAIAGIAALIGEIVQGNAGTGLFHSPDYPALTPLMLLVFYTVTFGIGEEPGWRGFALSALRQRFSPVVSTLILAGGWAGWHLPMFFFWPSFMAMGFAGALGWLVSLVLGALIMTMLVELGRGSLLAPVLFHGALNTAFAYDGQATLVSTVAGMLVTLVGIAAGAVLLRRRRIPRPV